LRVDFDESVEEEFIISAWRDGIRRSWKDEANGSTTRRELNEALRTIADVRGSAEMHRVWEREKGSVMTVDTAYSTLGVSKEMDENTLITVFEMRVSEITSWFSGYPHSPRSKSRPVRSKNCARRCQSLQKSHKVNA
jgi:ubiquitin carboxyl-terminal hydrolase 25/28